MTSQRSQALAGRDNTPRAYTTAAPAFPRPHAPILSSDRAFADFLARVPLRHETVVWSEARLIEHLYDEETERLRPFARGAGVGRVKRKRKDPKYHFTDRQLQIARESLARQERRAS